MEKKSFRYTANEFMLFKVDEDKRSTYFRLLFALFSLCMSVFVFRVHAVGIGKYRFANARDSCGNWAKV